MFRTIEERNTLVEEHLTLAKKRAQRKYSKVHKTVQLGELLSAAYVGLIDAARRYDENKLNDQGEKTKASFEVYARRRIDGEMTDYLRSCTWGTRHNCFVPMSLERHTYGDSGGGDDDGSPTVGETLQDKRREQMLNVAGKQVFDKIVRSLPMRDKAVFRMRFRDGLTMREIAERVNITESRVSQIISDSIVHLKKVWGDREVELWGEANGKI